MAHLVLQTGPDKGKMIPLPPEGEALFGRDASNAFQILDLAASRIHFKVAGTRGAYRLEDLQSRNGTFLNGAKTGAETLKPGDEIRVGDMLFLFAGDPRPPEPPRPAAPAPDDRWQDPMVGRSVGGYQITEAIGRGGMGTVYKAKQISLGRDVAFKILSARYTKDEVFVEKFVREARAAGALNHPNIVQVYDVGREGDLNYFSMELMSRGSVGDLLKQLGTLSVPRALAMILQAAKGLEYAEKRKIIHCDIKPDNLMLNEEGTVKIVDLGLSRTGIEGQSGEDEEAAFGTPHFVSPEQAQRKKIDHRADLYSLGATFFNMITGQPPFSGATAREIVSKHIKEPAPSVKTVDPAIPDSVARIIEKLLRKNPDDRYASATALLDDLRGAYIEVNPQAAFTDGFPGVPAQEKGRHTGLIALGAVSVVVVLAAFLLLPVLFGGNGNPPQDPGNGPENPGNAEPGEEPDNGGTPPPRTPVEPRNPPPEKKGDGESRFDDLCQQATEALKDTRELQKAMSDDDPKAVENLEALARKYPDTPAGKEAAESAAALKKAQEIRRKKKAEAAERLAPIEREVRALLEKKRFGTAIRKFEEFPRKEFEDTEAARTVADGILFIQERAKDEWVVGKGRSADLERQGRFDEAKKFFEDVIATWEMESFCTQAKAEISRLDGVLKARQEADRTAQTQADRALLAAAEAEALRLAEAYDFRGARDRVRGILPLGGTGAFLSTAEAQEKARLLLGDYDRLAAFKARVVAEAERRKGTANVRIPAATGTEEKEGKVRGADDTSIQVQVGGATTTIPWTSFKAEGFFEAGLRILGEDVSPADRLSLGVFALVLGLTEKVEPQLNIAVREGDGPTRQAAEAYLQRFRGGAGKAGQQVEAEARALYQKIVEGFQKAESEPNHEEACKLLKKAIEDLDRLAKEYGHTQFVKERLWK